MGIEEDRIELTGSDYERKLYDLRKGYVSQYLVRNATGRWDFQATRPQPGQGVYIERMPDGSCRKWNNRDEKDRTYTPA